MWTSLKGRVESHQSGRRSFHDLANVNSTIESCSLAHPSAESGSEKRARSRKDGVALGKDEPRGVGCKHSSERVPIWPEAGKGS